MKRIAILLLALVLVLGLFAGCTKSGNEPSSTPASSGTSNSGTSNAGSNEPAEPVELTLPLTDEQVTMTMFISSSMIPKTMQDAGQILAFQELEKRTNVHWEYNMPSEAAEAEAFNLLFVDNTYPDVITAKSLAAFTGGPDKYIEMGVVLDLVGIGLENAPNYMAALRTDDECIRGAYTDTGYLPAFRQVLKEKQPCYLGLLARQDWLDDVGYTKTPETFDEFHEMLLALKGKSSGQTMYLASTAGTDADFLQGFQTSAGLYLDHGTVKYGPQTQGFKDYLAMMSQWYGEGLIDEGFAARIHFYVDMNMFVGGEVAVYPHVYTMIDMMDMIGKSGDPNFSIKVLPYPKQTAGMKRYTNTGAVESILGGSCAVITSSCVNPTLCMRWWDYLYSEDGSLVANYGVENESYVMENGMPKYTEIVTANPDGLSEADAAKAVSLNPQVPFLYDWRREITSTISEKALSALEIWDADWDRENSYSLPSVTLTDDESREYTSTYNDISTLVNEFSAGVIVGNKNLDAEWDGFQQQLISMGIEKCIQIQQTAVDRYYARDID